MFGSSYEHTLLTLYVKPDSISRVIEEGERESVWARNYFFAKFFEKCEPNFFSIQVE